MGVVTYNTALQAAPIDDRLLGIFSTGTMPVWLDRNVYLDNLIDQENNPTCDGSDATDIPGLREMTMKAIEVLENRSGDEGWFIMSEAASVDKQMHALDYDRRHCRPWTWVRRVGQRRYPLPQRAKRRPPETQGGRDLRALRTERVREHGLARLRRLQLPLQLGSPLHPRPRLRRQPRPSRELSGSQERQPHSCCGARGGLGEL